MNDFKRKFERIETHIVLSYKGERDEIFNSSQLLDISRKGMQFTTSKPYPVDSRIIINVIVPTSYPNKLGINGRVAHSHEKLKGLLYHTGIEFINNPPEIEQEIQKYLDYLGADKSSSSSEELKGKQEAIEQEKRRYKRLKSQVIIQYVELGGESIKSSQIVDISEGGLLFNSDAFIAPGRQIRLKMTVPTSFPRPIKLEGEVKHCQEIMKGQLYQVGIEFSKEFNEPLDEVKKYVAFLEKKENS